MPTDEKDVRGIVQVSEVTCGQPSTLLPLSPNFLEDEKPHSVTKPATPEGWLIAVHHEPCPALSGPTALPVLTGSLPVDTSPAPQPGAQRKM